jgi:hypothetical protein
MFRSLLYVGLSARLKSRSRQRKSGRTRSLRRISTGGRLGWRFGSLCQMVVSCLVAGVLPVVWTEL